MSSSIDHKEYLKKYLGNGTKKKKVKITKGKGTRIVDDDVTAPAPTAEDADDGVLDAAEERPQVVSVTSDAPPTAADKRWKTLDECDLDELESQREILSESLKMLEGTAPGPADSSDDKEAAARGAAAAAPPARRRHDSDSSAARSASSASESSDSDSDSARRRRRRRRDSDASPPRKRPAARRDSDGSPPRRGGRREPDAESPAKKSRARAGSDASPPRRKPAAAKRAPSADRSPPRKKPTDARRRDDSDASPARRRAGDGRSRRDSDASPPRRRADRPPERAGDDGARRKSEPDAARRKPADDKSRGEAAARRGRHDSPSPRRRAADDRRPAGRTRKDSDGSPPRRPRAGRDGSADSASPRRPWRRPQNSNHTDSPQAALPTHTQDGKKAGLQDINMLREENRSARRREQQKLSEMDESLTGRHAETKVRGRKLQENKEKAAKKEEEEAKAKERKKKYDAWGKGLKQAEDRRSRVEHHAHEANKPLARYVDDTDLEAELRNKQRQEDPMAEYMQRKKAKQTGPAKVRPRYNKSEPPPNRYGIWPGYRWDGVDRSSGFEKELFLRRNAKKAREIDAYKWSTEDM